MREGVSANRDNIWILKGFISAFALCVVTTTLLYLTFETMHKGSVLRVLSMAFAVVGFIFSLSCIGCLINHYVSQFICSENVQFSFPMFCRLRNRRVNEATISEDFEEYRSLPRAYGKTCTFTDKSSTDILNCDENLMFLNNKIDEPKTTIIDLGIPGMDSEGKPNSHIHKLFESGLYPDVNLELVNEHQDDVGAPRVDEPQGKANAQLIKDCQGKTSVQVNEYQGNVNEQLRNEGQGEVCLQLFERQGEANSQLKNECQGTANVELVNGFQDEANPHLINERHNAGAKFVKHCLSATSELKERIVSSNQSREDTTANIVQCKAEELQSELLSPSFTTVSLSTNTQENMFTDSKEGGPPAESHKVLGRNRNLSSALMHKVINRSGIVSHFKRFLRLSQKSRDNKYNAPARSDDRDSFEVKLDAFILFPSFAESPQMSPAIQAKCSSVKENEVARDHSFRRTSPKQASRKILPPADKNRERTFPNVLVDAMNSLLNRKEKNLSDEISLGYASKKSSHHSNFSSWVFTSSEDSLQNSVMTVSAASEGCRSTPFSSTTSLNDPINSESSMVSNMYLFRTFNRRMHLSSPSIASSYF